MVDYETAAIAENWLQKRRLGSWGAPEGDAKGRGGASIPQYLALRRGSMMPPLVNGLLVVGPSRPARLPVRGRPVGHDGHGSARLGCERNWRTRLFCLGNELTLPIS